MMAGAIRLLAVAFVLLVAVAPQPVPAGDDPTTTATPTASSADFEGDGLSNHSEWNIHGTDPTNPDTDNDGLSDGAEVTEYDTSPIEVDTDGDGYSDSEEVNAGTDPTDADSHPTAITTAMRTEAASETAANSGLTPASAAVGAPLGIGIIGTLLLLLR